MNDQENINNDIVSNDEVISTNEYNPKKKIIFLIIILLGVIVFSIWFFFIREDNSKNIFPDYNIIYEKGNIENVGDFINNYLSLGYKTIELAPTKFKTVDINNLFKKVEADNNMHVYTYFSDNEDDEEVKYSLKLINGVIKLYIGEEYIKDVESNIKNLYGIRQSVHGYYWRVYAISNNGYLLSFHINTKDGLIQKDIIAEDESKIDLSGYDDHLYFYSYNYYLKKDNNYYIIEDNSYDVLDYKYFKISVNESNPISNEENLAFYSNFGDINLRVYEDGSFSMYSLDSEKNEKYIKNGKVGYIFESGIDYEIDIIPRDNIKFALYKYNKNDIGLNECIIIYNDDTYIKYNETIIYNSFDKLLSDE